MKKKVDLELMDLKFKHVYIMLDLLIIKEKYRQTKLKGKQYGKEPLS